MKKDIFIGMFVGLIANAIGLFLAANLLGKGDDFILVIQAEKHQAIYMAQI